MKGFIKIDVSFSLGTEKKKELININLLLRSQMENSEGVSSGNESTP